MPALHHPDGIILDLEDAVAPDKKHEATVYCKKHATRCEFLWCRTHGSNQPDSIRAH